VPSLFVMNARGQSVSPDAEFGRRESNFHSVADRPVRAAGHLLTQHVLEDWTDGSFAKDPPNATVTVMSKDGASVRDAVVELREGDRLTFDVRVLESDLAGADDPASVFVDNHWPSVRAAVSRRRRPAHGTTGLLVRRRDRRGGRGIRLSLLRSSSVLRPSSVVRPPY
jgi:hypothetical protein